MESLEFVKNVVMGLGPPDDYYLTTPLVEVVVPKKILAFSIKKRLLSEDHHGAVHHRFNFAIAIDGSGYGIIDGEKIAVEEGQCLLIHPHQSHFFIHHEPEINWLLITFELESSEYFKSLKNTVQPFGSNCIELLRVFLLDYTLANRVQKKLSAKRSLILGAILQEVLLHSNKVRHEEKAELSFESQIVDEINNYICGHLHLNLNIGVLAKKFNYSSSHLRALYKKDMGISLGAFVQKMRIHQAQSLLVSTKKRINEIAEECGYDSVYAFSHAFKNMRGVSPLQYRKEKAVKT